MTLRAVLFDLDETLVPVSDKAVKVGDTLERDIVGAHNAGIRSILVRRDPESSNEPAGGGPAPDATVSDLTELAAHLG